MNRIILFLVGCMFIFSVGCKKDEPSPTPAPEKKELVNPNPAQNNADIISQHLSDRVQSFYDTKIYNGEIYTLGNIEGKTNVMKINHLGDVIWAERPQLSSVQNIFVNANGVFVVGNYDSNSDNKNDRSKVIAYSFQGGYLAEYSFVASNYEATFLNDVIANENEIIMGGCVEKNGIQYPYLVKTSFIGNKFSLIKEQVYSQFPKQRIGNIQYHNDYLYYTANEYVSVTDEIHKSNITKVKYDTQEVIWTLPIVSDNPQHRLLNYFGSGIVINDKDIYLGMTTDDDKLPQPSSGGFWESGLVVKVADNTTSASIVWKKKIAISNKSEELSKLFFYNNTLYALGEHSSLQYVTEPKKSFSNGLIVKLDTNGTILSTKSFGEKEKRNVFWAGIVLNGQLIALGRIADPENTNHKAWIVKTAL